MEAVLTGINGMLSLNFLLSVSGCHVYGTFVAAVAIIVSVLAFGPVFNWLSVLVFFVDRVKPHFDCRTRSSPLSVPCGCLRVVLEPYLRL